jgi:hypothetical protein
MRRTVTTILLAGLSAAALAGPAAASSVGVSGPPAWAISSASDPTNFAPGGTLVPAGEEETLVPGDSYVLTAINTGGSWSDGSTITISDVLPEGLTAVKILGSDLGRGQQPLHCELATLTCTYNEVVVPGDSLEVTIVVSVAASPPQPLINRATISGGGGSSASTSSPTTLSAQPPPFGISSATAATSTAQAGAHPNLTTSLMFNASGLKESAGRPKDVEVELPPGLIGDPKATPQCTMGAVAADTCTSDMAVGVATVRGPGIPGYNINQYSDFLGVSLVYNIKPNVGEPAAFGFAVASVPVRLDASVRSDGDYGVRVSASELSDAVGIFRSSVTIWGVPQDHNGPGEDVTTERVAGRIHSFGRPGAGARLPFLTNPTACAGGLSVSAASDQWRYPGVFSLSPPLQLPTPTGCGLLSFEPSLSLAPDTPQAGTPAGYHLHLHIPQSDDPDGLATAELKSAVVTLPPGTVASPSAANGLEGCSDSPSDPSGDQLGLHSTRPASCPPASQIGSVSVKTPLLADPLEGHVFLGKPSCAPCGPADASQGKMIRLFIVVQGQGVTVKLRGSASIDPNTGQLTTTFAENPQLPFEDLELTLNGGPRAPLANPRTCGQLTSTSDLTPWSSPLTPDASLSSPLEITGCPAPRFQPSLTAGTTNNQAAAFSPFSLTLSRTDSDQQLSGIQIKTPPGLLGMLSTVALCPEPQAQAGTCPPESLIGHTTAGSGPGSEPLYISGQVFLTGPYGGAPFGLSIVVPAVAGPFNLGNVLVRAAISVDPATSALTITSDPLPRILDGIPLALKVINVTVDRPAFMFNPTNCNPLAIKGTVSSTQGATATVSSPFQAANCTTLPFKPSFTARTQATSAKAKGASLDVKVGYPRGAQANIRSVAVSLPASLPSRLTTLQQACTDAQFAANPAGCPAGSNVGFATATTPVLQVPLTGPAYLVSHGGAAFPDLVVVLQAVERVGRIRIDLTGHTDIKRGVTYSNFDTVPDAPISSFELILPQGPHSVLAATRNLCALTKTVTIRRHGKRVKRTIPDPLLMPTTITGQNGAVVKQNTRIAVTGCQGQRPRRASRARKPGHARGRRGR